MALADGICLFFLSFMRNYFSVVGTLRIINWIIITFTIVLLLAM